MLNPAERECNHISAEQQSGLFDSRKRDGKGQEPDSLLLHGKANLAVSKGYARNVIGEEKRVCEQICSISFDSLHWTCERGINKDNERFEWWKCRRTMCITEEDKQSESQVKFIDRAHLKQQMLSKLFQKELI